MMAPNEGDTERSAPEVAPEPAAWFQILAVGHLASSEASLGLSFHICAVGVNSAPAS